MGAVFLFDCITPGRRDLLHNEEKLKNPIEFMGKCGGLPGKMDRALDLLFLETQEKRKDITLFGNNVR